MATKIYNPARPISASSKFGGPEDTQPQMTKAAKDAVKPGVALLKGMTPAQREGALAFVHFLNDQRSGAGNKRLWGVTVPEIVATVGHKS